MVQGRGWGKPQLAARPVTRGGDEGSVPGHSGWISRSGDQGTHESKRVGTQWSAHTARAYYCH